jgi:hypothetical protein
MIKVLCIEDNDDNVYMLKMRFELLDEFEVLTAEDGEKGCNTAAAERSRGYCADSSFIRSRLSRRLDAARERPLLGRSPRQPPSRRARPWRSVSLMQKALKDDLVSEQFCTDTAQSARLGCRRRLLQVRRTDTPHAGGPATRRYSEARTAYL